MSTQEWGPKGIIPQGNPIAEDRLSRIEVYSALWFVKGLQEENPLITGDELVAEIADNPWRKSRQKTQLALDILNQLAVTRISISILRNNITVRHYAQEGSTVPILICEFDFIPWAERIGVSSY